MKESFQPSEKSVFEVVEETPYGPHLRRKDQVDSVEYADVSQEEDIVDHGRRIFLIKAGAATAVTAAGVAGVSRLFDEPAVEDAPRVEEKEVVPKIDDDFEKEVTGYTAQLFLAKDEVLFVDESNVPIGEPLSLGTVYSERRPPNENTKPEQIGEDGMRAYAVRSGETNQLGLPIDGIAPEWQAKAKAEVQARHPDQLIDRMLHVHKDFNKAVTETDEPELVAGITRGEINRPIDIVQYFADKPVRGAEYLSRREYVSEAVVFKDVVPTTVQREFCRLLPGLCAQESKFNAGLESSVGALGIFQIMPYVWKFYDGEVGGHTSLKQQAEIVGSYLSDLYCQVKPLIGEDLFAQIQDMYDSKEAFQTQFLVPVILNAYNAGIGRLAEAVKLYFEKTSTEQQSNGSGLFLAIADFAEDSKDGQYLMKYCEHSREYVPKIYAQVAALEEVYGEGT